jgi:hypothetical protein
MYYRSVDSAALNRSYRSFGLVHGVLEVAFRSATSPESYTYFVVPFAILNVIVLVGQEGIAFVEDT